MVVCRQQANQKAHQEYLDSVRRKEHEREAERKADEARKMRDEVNLVISPGQRSHCLVLQRHRRMS